MASWRTRSGGAGGDEVMERQPERGRWNTRGSLTHWHQEEVKEELQNERFWVHRAGGRRTRGCRRRKKEVIDLITRKSLILAQDER